MDPSKPPTGPSSAGDFGHPAEGRTVAPAQDRAGRSAAPPDEEAWRCLPRPTAGGGGPLPSWARALAGAMPRSTAALLLLDLTQRSRGPVDPALRAGMRWVAARANRCEYAMAYASHDARRAGLDAARVEALGRERYPGWSPAERRALNFARRMTLDSDSVSDGEFAGLVADFGERRAASMVLLLAYANFQDRLLICLDAPVEPGGPTPPPDITFDASAFTTRTTPPPPAKSPPESPPGRALGEVDPSWAGVSYERLQRRIEAQRDRPTRLRVPSWDEVAGNLPEGLFARPSDIVWYRICFGYAPELAVPFEIFMRTAGSEAGPGWDRVLAQGLFWVTTKAVMCPYCMGHCEMNWEVAGLSAGEIAARSRLLAGDDWSGFPPAERHAYSFARNLAVAPWSVADEDLRRLGEDFGPDLALTLVVNACRYHYMTRVSNGFQLRLERENVFHDYYDARPRADPGAA